jgi:hypothetical protein
LVKSESEWQAIASANDGNCAYYSSGNGSTTFRVPKLPTTLTADIADEFGVKGNGMALGLTNGSVNAGMCVDAAYEFTAEKGNYGDVVGKAQIGGLMTPVSVAVGVTTDPTKSGIVAKTSATKITGQWLIVAFGVAHNIGEADVANVMQAVEQVQTGLGTLEQGVGTAIDYIVESYRNGTEWYRIWKSGWVEQGGYDSNSSGTITLHKAFTDNNYYLNFSPDLNSTNGAWWSAYGNERTTTNFKHNGSEGRWYACGQGA